GGSGETSAFGPTKNPRDTNLIPGGSSSGSAAAVAARLCDFALGSDTGGSIRNPASHCGVIGLKPTYGAVSRYGLLDMSMSLDQIGPITNSVEDAKFIFDVIKGQDNFDSTTQEFKDAKPKKKYTIGLVNVEKFANKEISNLIEKKTKDLAKKNNWEIKEVHLPLDIATQTYYIMVYVEFFSATRKFDGRRFGKKIEEVAGPEVLRRILGGSEISQAEYAGKYYRESLKAKKYIREQFEKLFKEVDFLVMPTVPKTAHKVGEQISVEEMYGYDVLTVLANLGGLPAISIPIGEIDKKAVGLQILAPHFHEEIIFDVGSKLS
ncbi:Asp-tRNA(Asn)/Glu-tRNA(Gln) amidotransferase subunit GatA, partial [archaeon]|nr:Asp-tRNA(Asn)/Glu-tRNA(Gln) amidotransferase subunit GatA [archaeon]